jgi:hypothetical protein
MFDLNPLDVLKKRKVNFLPVHFSQIKLSEYDLVEGNLENWVKTKLKGRYYISRVPILDNSGKLRSTSILALEDQKEMTYFMLACPYLRRT